MDVPDVAVVVVYGVPKNMSQLYQVNKWPCAYFVLAFTTILCCSCLDELAEEVTGQ